MTLLLLIFLFAKFEAGAGWWVALTLVCVLKALWEACETKSK